MKKQLLVLLLSCASQLNASELPEYEYGSFISLMEAFMQPKKIDAFNPEVIYVADYEKENVKHEYTVIEAIDILKNIKDEMQEAMRIDSCPDAQRAVKILKSAPELLTQKDKYFLQAVEYYYFFTGQEIDPKNPTQCRIYKKRMNYINSWTNNNNLDLLIKKAKHIYVEDQPFVPFTQKIKEASENNNDRP